MGMPEGERERRFGHAAESSGRPLRYRDLFDLFELMPDAVLVTDGHGRYVSANHAAERLLGYSEDELCRLRVRDVLVQPDGDADAVFRRFAHTLLDRRLEFVDERELPEA